MKTSHFFTSTLLAIALCGSLSAQPNVEKAQGPKPEGKPAHVEHARQHDGLNLSEEQQAKFKELRLAHDKEILPLKNQLAELEAKEHSLSTAEKADLKAINANIDEITKVQNQIMKADAANIQKLRSLLTDEQRIQFDSKKGHRGGKEFGGKGRENHQGGFANHMSNKGPEKGCDMKAHDNDKGAAPEKK